MADAGKINSMPVEDKTVEDEPFLYANKQVMSLDMDTYRQLIHVTLLNNLNKYFFV